MSEVEVGGKTGNLGGPQSPVSYTNSDTYKGEESPKLVASTTKLDARARSKKDTTLASEGAEVHQEQAKTNVLIDKN